MAKFSVGDKVKVPGTKDAVIIQIVKINKRTPGKTMYCVEYTVDDQLERDNPTGKRYCQPRLESELAGK